jgi:release factor glutamine methyltransferase
VNRRQALTRVREALTAKRIDDASMEGEILLRHVLGINRTQLFTDLDGKVSPVQAKDLMKLVARRVSGEPSAYITGHREFYCLDFKVNHNVLIPRPETELLVEKAISLCRNHGALKIADIGTGCGAIAIALAVNLPEAIIYAADISPAALEIARENGDRHGVTDRVTFLQGDMLEPLPGPVDLIIANLPYVRESELYVESSLSFEPGLALNGGEKGIDKINILCRQAVDKLNRHGSLLLEIGQRQAEAVKNILGAYFLSALIEVARDLAGIERMVSLRLT